jgi:DNA-binding MarR family transcriptional regulator
VSKASETALKTAWQELANRYAECSCALDRELEARHGLSATEFDVLERLATQRPDGHSGCRMQELTDAVPLSQSALSRLVARLEREGLVERAMCSDDRRGIFAVLTDAGRERYEAARPTQRAVLADVLGDAAAAQSPSLSTSA